MKEYKIEMQHLRKDDPAFAEVKDKWFRGHSPNSMDYKTFTNKAKAKAEAKRLREAWRKYIEERHPDIPETPEFRIVSREVTEWTVEE